MSTLTTGVVPPDRRLAFVDVWRLNGDLSPLPPADFLQGDALRRREIERRSQRVVSKMMEHVSGDLSDGRIIAEHFLLLEGILGPILSPPNLQPPIVLSPPEVTCVECGAELVTESHGRALKVLTFDGVLEGIRERKVCACCKITYSYDTVTRQTGLPSETVAFRDDVLGKQYMLDPVSRFRGSLAVQTAMLAHHHAYNERTQVSAFGEMEALRAAFRLRGVPRHGWSTSHNASDRFDNFYFAWVTLDMQVRRAAMRPRFYPPVHSSASRYPLVSHPLGLPSPP